jgi:PmbA protein
VEKRERDIMDYNDLNDELLSAVDTGIKYASSLDKSAEFEVFLYYDNALEVEIDQGVVTAKDGIISGTAVRAAKGKRVSFACSSGISEDRVKVTVREALAIVDTIKVEDDKFQGFADPTKPGKEGAYHEDIFQLTTEDLIKASEEIIKDAEAVDERIKMVSSGADASWGGYAVGNTRGVQASTRYCQNGCGAYAMAIVGDDRKGVYWFDGARDRLFNTEGIGTIAAEGAVGLLNAKKLGVTTKMTTIWKPLPAACYILASLGQAVSGKPVVEQISPLCDRLGDKIAPSELTITDSGQNPKGLGTYAIDSEGTGQRENSLLDNGVLKSFLFDSYYGRVSEVASTGSSSRGGSGIFGGVTPYESPPRISTKWLSTDPGSKSYDEIISSIDGKAVLIVDMPIGIFHSNLSTGDFSAVASSAYLVEDGEKKHALQAVPVAGNFYEGFKNITAIGNDTTFLSVFNSVTPTLVFDGFSVVGE